MNNKLSSTGVALVTPFDSNNEVDFDALGSLINYVTQNGVNYLVALGTTAETPTLSSDEKQHILDFVVKQNAGKLPIVVGIGGNSTSEVISTIKKTNLTGVDAILSVTPYYNKPSQRGIYEHYKAIAEQSPLPIVMYNVPGRTGVNMAATTTLKLAHDVKNIAGIKEASDNLTQMGCIVRDRPKNFVVVSGDDGLTLPQMAMGIDGAISVAANAFPALFSSMINFARNNNFAEAAKLHLKLIDAVDLLFAEGNPVGVKAALYLRGIIKNNLRLPLVPATEPLVQKMKNLIDSI